MNKVSHKEMLFIMTEIDLITGVLGSGKTTFIKKYARHLIESGQRIAILENDFGAVNVDMMLLQDLKCDNCQLEMILGGGDPDCHKRRFKTQLIALAMQHFDRIVMEPSGIFDMDEFFDTLYEPPLDGRIRISNIFTVVDAEVPDTLSDQMEYLFASESACSGKLILSKINKIPEGKLSERVDSIISHLNRSLEYIGCPRRFKNSDMLVKNWDELDNDDLNELMTAGYRGESYVKMFSPEDIRSMTHYFMHIRVKQALLPKIINGIFEDEKCGKIYRIKGFTQDDNGNWLKINALSDRIEIAPISDGQTVFIVIGDNVNREQVDKHFKEFNTDTEYISI